MKKEPLSLTLSKLILVVALIVGIGSVLGVLGYYLTNPKPVFVPTPKMISAIEISTDAKSILNAETKETIFTIAHTQKYLKDSGYFYNPDTFQDTNAKHAGDCFTAAALSNNKDRIVFSTGCLAGDLPQAWIGIYNIPSYSCRKMVDGEEVCLRFPATLFKFLVAGSGRNFIWSQDDKTITYEADLRLSGMTEMRTIDAGTGEVLETEINSEKKEELLLVGISKLIYEAYKNSLGNDYDLSGIIESIKNNELFFTDMFENPYDNSKVAITIKYKDYSKPHGVFIIDTNKEIVENQYIFIGALEHLYIENVKWSNKNELSFNSVVVDEGGVNKRPKILKVDETADWKTYKNENGFEVKYPQNLEAKYPVPDVFIVYAPSEDKKEYLQIQWLDINTTLPFTLKSNGEPVGYKPNGAEYVGKKIIGGKESIKFYTDNPFYKEENDLPFTNYIIKLGDREWIDIGYHGGNNASNLFEKIIFTFKFTEK